MTTGPPKPLSKTRRSKVRHFCSPVGRGSPAEPKCTSRDLSVSPSRYDDQPAQTVLPRSAECIPLQLETSRARERFTLAPVWKDRRSERGGDNLSISIDLSALNDFRGVG